MERRTDQKREEEEKWNPQPTGGGGVLSSNVVGLAVSSSSFGLGGVASSSSVAWLPVRCWLRRLFSPKLWARMCCSPLWPRRLFSSPVWTSPSFGVGVGVGVGVVWVWVCNDLCGAVALVVPKDCVVVGCVTTPAPVVLQWTLSISPFECGKNAEDDDPTDLSTLPSFRHDVS